MNSPFARHPEDGALLRYLDGELTARQQKKVASHLEACGQCRAELDELKSTIADCLRYRQEVLAAHLPEAPLPWRDLYRDFSRIDESLATDSLLVRLMRPLVHSGAPRWTVAAGLAALVVCGVFFQLRQAPSVQAASLLTRAVTVSQNKPRPARRALRVRTARQEFTRSVGSRFAVEPATTQILVMAALFQSARFNWDDPLSAASFQAWRDQQPNKTDEITTVANPQQPAESCQQIRTTAAEGAIAEASITLCTEDLTPVAERLEFRDEEWVELSEIAESFTGNDGGAVASHVEVPVRAAEPPSRPAAFAPGSEASISDEIQVLSELNKIGADLGDPVEVKLAEGKVLVTGIGLTPGRQKEIENRLAALPHVQVRFNQPLAATVPAEAATGAGPSAGDLPRPPIQARLEKNLGGRSEFERFSAQILDLDEQAMQRVYALRKLAQTFPADSEAQLNSKDTDILRELSRKHAAVLAEKVSNIERILVPVLSNLGGTAAGVRTSGQTAWQPAAEDIYRNARRVEVLLSQMLGMTPSAVSTATIPSELLATLRDLRASLEACQHLL